MVGIRLSIYTTYVVTHLPMNQQLACVTMISQMASANLKTLCTNCDLTH